MAIGDKISIETCFELNNSPENFKITDDTNYSSEGIALTDVVGIFKEIKDPTGNVVYSNNDFNSPDIDLDASRSDSSVSLPKDSDGNVVQGEFYEITYAIKVSGGTQPGEYKDTFKYKFDHTDPVVQVEYVVDCECSELTSKDTTDYVTSSRISSTSKTRTHEIYPPAGSTKSKVSTSQAEKTVTDIVTNTWETVISTDVTWTYDDGLCVIDTIKGSDEVKVQCDLHFCDIFCCIDNVYTEWSNAIGVDEERAKTYKAKLTRILDDVTLFQIARQCGQVNDSNTYYNDILATANCSKGCGCDDETPQSVIPFCGPSSSTDSITEVEVCSGNNALTIAESTTGDTTKYQLCFKQSVYDRIFKNYVARVQSSDGSVTVNETTDADGDYKYDLSVSSPANETDMMTCILEITWSSLSSIPTLNIKNVSNYGVFGNSPAASWINDQSVSEWKDSPMCIDISSLGTSSKAKPIVQTINKEPEKAVSLEGNEDGDCWTDIPLDSTVYQPKLGAFNFRLDYSGTPVTPNRLIDKTPGEGVPFTKIEVSILITV